MKADSTNATASGRPKVNGWKAVFPPAQWVPTYEGRWLKDDLLAGITLGAYALPEGVAYASLAGLTPEGIYGYLLGGIGYALFGSSRHLAIGPTCAISLMVGLVQICPLCILREMAVVHFRLRQRPGRRLPTGTRRPGNDLPVVQINLATISARNSPSHSCKPR